LFVGPAVRLGVPAKDGDDQQDRSGKTGIGHQNIQD
jgi:hypothetical protein